MNEKNNQYYLYKTKKKKNNSLWYTSIFLQETLGLRYFRKNF